MSRLKDSAIVGKDILIVEDSPTQAEQLRSILERHNYRVTTASNGKIALAAIARLKPSLIISDIVMPQMDGYELCRRIKMNESYRNIPVILLTALSELHDVIRALECCADNFITKPYNEELLVSTIKYMQTDRFQPQHEISEEGLELHFGGKDNMVNADRRQILNLLLSTYETAIEKNRALSQTQGELNDLNDQLEKRVEERTEELALTIKVLQEEISKRKQAEKSLSRLNRLYRVLSETNKAIVCNSDRNALFKSFCRIAIEHGGFRLAWVGLVDMDTGVVNILEAQGETGFLDGIRISVKGREPEGQGPAGIAIREGTHYICNDFLGSTNTLPWQERARANGICSVASIVLKQGGHAIGALTLSSGKKDFFDSEQVDILLQMGTDISFALDNINYQAERQRAELELQEETLGRLQAVQALHERDQILIHQNRLAAMGEMINYIAHQWRQPLNALSFIIQSLAMEYETGELTEEYLKSIEGKAMKTICHMSQTINDFRNYFKPDKEKVYFNVGQAVSNTLSLIDGSFKSLDIGIEINVSDDPIINGYPNLYLQVLINILSNAIDAFSERKSSDPRVTISLSTEKDKTVVTIADNAGGIPEMVMEKIFEPYFTTKGPDKGTGIGLFISKNIIEKNMGGRLTVRNTCNGAEFRIEV